jgi:tetratricopeptide (TPR) repeat protein
VTEEVTVDECGIDAEQLSAALLEIEDRYLWDAADALARSIEYERQAVALGDDLLAARARLCQANMLMRNGDVAAAARRIWKIHQWTVDHGAGQLQARTHLVWANIHRHLGDAAQCLEHSLLSVELLDDDATPHMQIWHHAKLADALGLAGSMDAARLRYAQSEELCLALDQPRLLMGILNNYAYTEYAAGNHEQAQEVAERLQTLAERHGYELDPAVLDTIGAIEIENGRFAGAERTLQVCIDRHAEGHHEDADAMAEYSVRREVRGTRPRGRRCRGAGICALLPGQPGRVTDQPSWSDGVPGSSGFGRLSAYRTPPNRWVTELARVDAA